MTDIRYEVVGSAGVITLDRPKALNALTHAMVVALDAALDQAESDENVKLVLIRGAGERGLCAGGDIAELMRATNEEARGFWEREYALNLRISRFPKPYVAIMNGIVLGGGVGISAHGSHRIVTDDTRIGMPEVSIGFVPDVGGSYLLSRAPHNLGLYLGLSGKHVGAAEAIAAQLADIFIPKDSLEAAVDKLCQTGDVNVLAEFSADPGEAFDGKIAEIEATYEGVGLDTIDQHWGTNSPVAVAVTCASIQGAKGLDLEHALARELVVSCNMHAFPDFVEGVRAMIIDKDRNPQWQPFDPTVVETMFKE
ncbi:MAG: 3-hydroxyisobutyryl-CoA hydrolase [Corynebacterium sp.]|uniref:3-hydroxyisobutyryl-CoA hydrolase n=1 Tax=Corynebacterium sp. TaxID=1720 RepID=UPI0026DB1E16|nr:3-hydroxyisobutyryl-CoA hydrolase [Corynebacterium sp.]MDO4760453.1 3-hydroxyisobutyryl-CoA hydrolase [Corynebacterium sp.]